MGYDRIRIKAGARRAVREASPRPWLVTLLLWFLLADLSALSLLCLMAAGLFSAGAGSPPLFAVLLAVALGVGLLLLSLLFHAGYTSYTLGLWREEKAGLAHLLQGLFLAPRILELWLRLLMHTLLWALPGGAVLVLLRRLSGTAPSWLLSAAAVLFGLYLLERVSRYALSLFCLLDKPEAGAQMAIARSKRLMAGRRRELLLFLLSFLGWILLSALVAGLFFLLGFLLLALVLSLSAQPSATLALRLLLPFQLLGIAAALPLILWLVSYLGTALAGFYDAACAPPFPGLQPPEHRRRDLL